MSIARIALVFGALSTVPSVLQAQTVAGSTPGGFRVTESGAAEYRIPIQVPPGIAGMEPKLALVYNSQAGNGLLGVGWNVEGLSAITRCPRTMAQDGVRGGVNYDWNDRYCLDGQRLVYVSGQGGYGGGGSEYRTERDSFSKVMSWDGVNAGPNWFTVRTKSGLTMEYGVTEDSRIQAQGKTAIRAWLVNKISDTKGNYVTFRYNESITSEEVYLSHIEYGGNGGQQSYVQFSYAARPDVSDAYVAGSRVIQSVRPTGASVTTSGNRVREYRFAWDQSAATGRSILTSIAECDGQAACLAPTTFAWSTQAAGFGGRRWETQSGGFWDTQKWFAADVDGDGRTDLINVFNDNGLTSIDVHLSTGSSFAGRRWETQSGGSWDTQKWFVADVNGDGRADLINVFNDNGLTSIDVHLSTGSSFAGQRWETQSGGFWDTQKWFVADVDGDGRADLINVFNDNGLTSIDVHLSTGSSFAGRRWETQSGGFWDAQQWFVADVNGDGLADLINLFNDNGLASIDVHLSTGNGFAGRRWETQSGGFWDTQKWFVADVNGDGLPDLVNVFNDNGLASIDVHLSTGASFAGRRWETQSGGFWDTQKWFAADLNGDGRADLINLFNDNGLASIDVHLSTGASFAGRRWETQSGGFWDSQRWFVSDFVGDGGSHLANLFNDNGLASMDIHLHDANADRIARFTDGLGLSHSVTYAPLTAPGLHATEASVYPVTSAQVPLFVVRDSVRLEPQGAVATSYLYGGLKAELGTGRGFLGFHWQERIDPQTGLRLKTEYRQDWPYTGMPTLVRKTHGADQVLSLQYMIQDCLSPRAPAELCSPGPGRVYFPYVARNIETGSDLNGALLPAVTTTTSYDAYGNAQGITVSGPSYSKTTTNTYSNDEANWLLGRLTRSVVASTSDIPPPPPPAGGAGGGGSSPPPSGPQPISIPALMVIVQMVLED